VLPGPVSGRGSATRTSGDCGRERSRGRLTRTATWQPSRRNTAVNSQIPAPPLGFRHDAAHRGLRHRRRVGRQSRPPAAGYSTSEGLGRLLCCGRRRSAGGRRTRGRASGRRLRLGAGLRQRSTRTVSARYQPVAGAVGLPGRRVALTSRRRSPAGPASQARIPDDARRPR
jgi:hypothetical protein